MTTSPSPSTSQPKKIIIRPYPFNSALGLSLVNALDADLSALHPDWDDLPHPGYQQGFVQTDYRANPLPLVPTEYQIGKRQTAPVPSALDADDTGEPTFGNDTASVIPQPAKVDDLPENWTHLDPEDVSKLHFFIAFDVTDIDDTTSSPTTPNPNPTSTSPDYTGTAIGCVGLKPMPYFPHHRPQASTPSLPPTTALRHAELKRMYVLPTHRRSQVTTSTNPEPVRLATALVQAAVQCAQQLGIEQLVLETGVRQVAAMRLYERLGWRRREMYGDYVGAGVEDGGVGVCYQFDLGV